MLVDIILLVVMFIVLIVAMYSYFFSYRSRNRFWTMIGVSLVILPMIYDITAEVLRIKFPPILTLLIIGAEILLPGIGLALIITFVIFVKEK